MSWEQLKRLQPERGSIGIRITAESSDRPRSKVRFGENVLKEMAWKKGEYVAVLFDVQNKRIAFKKCEPRDGYQLCGKHRSLCMSFTTPRNKNLSVLLAVYDRELSYSVDGKMVVIQG